MFKVNVRQVVSELGVEILSDSGSWLNGHCPLPEHAENKSSKSPASFAIATEPDEAGIRPPGLWNCKGCQETGNIVTLYAAINGITETEAAKILVDRWAPGMAPTRRVPGRLPTAEELATYLDNVDDDMLTHWTHVRAWSLKFIRSAGIGQLGGRMMIPIYTDDGQLVNVRTKPWKQVHLDASEKCKGIAGRRTALWPLMLLDRNTEVVITEGEPDAGALQSIGVNAITHTGGASSMKWKNFESILHTGEKTKVTICLDRDKAGIKAMQTLRRQCLEAGVALVRVIKLPDTVKDIEELLRSFEPDQRKIEWGKLYSEAKVYTASDDLGSGMWENGGRIVDGEGEEIAPWTARIVETGRQRFGQAEDMGRSFLVCLTHRTGKTCMVQLTTSDSFWRSVMDAGGPEWSFQRRYEDKLFHAICRASAGEAEKIDSGYIFGYENDDLTTFWTPNAVFGPNEIYPAEREIRMHAPNRILNLLSLPFPESAKCGVALKLVMEDLYQSHQPQVMGPMIASAFAAPVRRLLMPSEQTFAVMIYGRSGCGKTSRAREVQNLFSGHLIDDQMLESWKSTPKSIQQMCSYAGDSWLLIDELRLFAMPGNVRREVLGILQGIAQGAGRMSLTYQRNFRSPPEARCVLACTMEELPFDDESQLARSVMIHVPAIDLLDPIYRTPHDRVRKHCSLLPFAMAAWVRWLVTAPDETTLGPGMLDEKLKNQADEICRKLLDDLTPAWRGTPNAPRLFQRGVLLTTIWLLLLELCRTPQYAALNEGKCQDLVNEWIGTILPHYFQTSFANLAGAGPSELFLVALDSALQSGDAYFATREQNGEIVTTDGYPSWRAPNAKIIGLVVKVSPGTSGSVMIRGQNCKVILNSASVHLAKTRGVETSWMDVKQILANASLTAKAKSARLSNYRGLWLSKKGIERLLKPYVNVTSHES